MSTYGRIIATATRNRISDEEVEARAKMASFIDRVIETIQLTRRAKANRDK